MEKKNLIFNKLEVFIRKYYTNELLKGSILFLGIGLLYFIFTLLIEYFLWLKPFGRTFLFWTFISVEFFLLLRFILFPLFKLFKLKKGIDYSEASKIIGNHFVEVQDKLTNFLQLTNQSNDSELVLASIDQKANSLQPIPFSNAIDFSKNRKYVPFVLVPVLIFLVFILSGNSTVITQSFDRVVHYKNPYTPPAPFHFVLLNNNLLSEQGKDFTLQVATKGKVLPENVSIHIGDETYFLQNIKPGLFQYTFEKPLSSLVFNLSANNITSNDYELKIVEVPTIVNFKMTLQYPSYLNRKNETILGNGNAIVPEGTKVLWRINSVATTAIDFKIANSIAHFSTNANAFVFSKDIFQTTDYQLITSNKNLKDYEKLNYQLSVTKDQYPTIVVNEAPDSLKTKTKMLIGKVSDDYGLSRLDVVYYPKNQPNSIRRASLKVAKSLYDQFVYSFPTGLNLQKGLEYEYYFEIFDNDAIHRFKSSKSAVFMHQELTDNQKEDQLLHEQNSTIQSLEKSIKNQDKQVSELEKLQQLGKEKSNLDFKDQKKVQEFINRQKQQDEMMKEFSKKLQENLEEFNPQKKDEYKEDLMKRLEKNEKEIEKNEKLLKELEELTQKLKKEELFDKIDKLKQTTKDQNKNLEQLLELTKRFYVEKKTDQIADKLEELGKKEEQLSEQKDNTLEKQTPLNKEFDQIKEDLKELNKQNEDLKDPMDLPNDEKQQESIKEDLEKASEDLKKQNTAKAKPKQKNAAQKMQQLSKQMKQAMESNQSDQNEEDVKVLRQILDNLLAFSFNQEDLMKDFKATKSKSIGFNKLLKTQQDLKNQFKHIDDSLFTLSLRNPRISEQITKEVGNVQYNLEKAIENLSESIFQKGISHQQYTITSANKLADFLSETMNQMQAEMMMPMQGSGKGKPKPGKGGQGMQLPDIIKKQDGLSNKMKNGMKESNKEGEGKKGSNNDKNKQSGQEGDAGEGEAERLLEIYKEQKQLREALQKQLEKQGMGGNGQNALQQMKEIEKQLLNKGFKNETLQKMLNLKHELLKLDKAIQQQGEENKRQSQTNRKDFDSTVAPLSPEMKDYLKSVEILNRQSLPLRPNFNQKVQTYFKTND